MRELFTVLTRKGQITVPAEIRKALALKEGDRLMVALADPERGVVSLWPAQSVADRTYGAVGRPGSIPGDLDQLREQFEEGIGGEIASETTPERRS